MKELRGTVQCLSPPRIGQITTAHKGRATHASLEGVVLAPSERVIVGARLTILAVGAVSRGIALAAEGNGIDVASVIC